MRIEDHRPPPFPPPFSAFAIPDGAVFQGVVGSVRGTFKRNQTWIFQLDGIGVWEISKAFSFYSVVSVEQDYQRVHGKFVIERNA